MDPKCLRSEDILIVVIWYKQLKILIKWYGIQVKDIYNFDEIRFLEGQGCTQAVMTRNPERKQRET